MKISWKGYEWGVEQLFEILLVVFIILFFSGILGALFIKFNIRLPDIPLIATLFLGLALFGATARIMKISKRKK